LQFATSGVSTKTAEFVACGRVAAPPSGGGATNPSQFYLLGNAERVVHLDSEIADGALQLRVPQQKLNSSQVARRFLYLVSLRLHSVRPRVRSE
jgi:hypothetical protein